MENEMTVEVWFSYYHMYCLQSHGLVHVPEKTFECATCSYQCKRFESLRVHMRVHFTVKPYRCVLCQRQYTHLSQRLVSLVMFIWALGNFKIFTLIQITCVCGTLIFLKFWLSRISGLFLLTLLYLNHIEDVVNGNDLAMGSFTALFS